MKAYVWVDGKDLYGLVEDRIRLLDHIVEDDKKYAAELRSRLSAWARLWHDFAGHAESVKWSHDYQVHRLEKLQDAARTYVNGEFQHHDVLMDVEELAEIKRTDAAIGQWCRKD